MPSRPIGAGSAVICAGCRFYRPLTPAAGECRRNPPLVVLGQAAWVTVGADEAGCGEFVGIAPRQPGESDAPP